MTRHRAHISARTRRRRLVSLATVLALLVNVLMPLAQATAGPAAAGALLAAICSPNGIRYVEIELGPAESEAPHPPDLGTLEHCPGCLSAAAAVLPAGTTVRPPLVADEPTAPTSAEHATAPLAYTRFQPRAPPLAS